MTLYGEQKGEDFKRNWEVMQKNCHAWNAWAAQNFSSKERERISVETQLSSFSLDRWNQDGRMIEAQFKRAWRERNPDLEISELPSPEDEVVLASLRFESPLGLRGFLFPQNVHFSGSLFECKTDLASCIVDAGLYLNNCILTASDFGALRAKFGNFEGTKFCGDTFFYGSEFGSCTFENSDFLALAHFFSMSIAKHANFRFCAFSKDADFQSSSFGSSASFKGAMFKAKAGFDSVEFSGRSNWEAANFTGLVSKDKTFPSFRSCHFKGPVNFVSAFFDGEYPDLRGAVFPKNVRASASAEFWPQYPLAPARYSKEICSILRRSMSDQSLPEEEHFFFRKEMQFAGQSGTFLERLPFWFFGLVSGYGHSIIRPTIGLFALWVIPMLCYMIYFNWMAAFGGMEGQDVGMFDSVSLSFTSMFKFLGLQRLHFGADYIQALPWHLEFLTAFQTLGGIILLFFLGLGLRTRFRLR